MYAMSRAHGPEFAGASEACEFEPSTGHDTARSRWRVARMPAEVSSLAAAPPRMSSAIRPRGSGGGGGGGGGALPNASPLALLWSASHHSFAGAGGLAAPAAPVRLAAREPAGLAPPCCFLRAGAVVVARGGVAFAAGARWRMAGRSPVCAPRCGCGARPTGCDAAPLPPPERPPAPPASGAAPAPRGGPGIPTDRSTGLPVQRTRDGRATDGRGPGRGGRGGRRCARACVPACRALPWRPR